MLDSQRAELLLDEVVIILLIVVIYAERDDCLDAPVTHGPEGNVHRLEVDRAEAIESIVCKRSRSS